MVMKCVENVGFSVLNCCTNIDEEWHNAGFFPMHPLCLGQWCTNFFGQGSQAELSKPSRATTVKSRIVLQFLTARRYASAAIAVVMLSSAFFAGIVSKHHQSFFSAL